MEYDEAVERMAQLRKILGSGIKGDEYKAALQEYMALKQAIDQAGGNTQGGSNEVPWWQRRGGPSLL